MAAMAGAWRNNVTYETLLVEVNTGVGLITLNRPERLNALSSRLFSEFEEALTQLEEDDEVKVLLVTGAGERAFSAGADIHEMVEVAREGEPPLRRPTDWLWHLAAYRKPTIGVINGLAYGGGALMSSIFDIRLGSERSSFRFLAVTYSRVNSTWSLPLIVGWPVAKDLLFTGRLVEAEEATRIGLLNRQLPSEELMATAMEMGRQIAGNDTAAVQAVREIMVGEIGLSWREMMRREAEVVARSVDSPPAEKSFSGFLKKRKAR
jgi:enoyl-CoA hydratase